MFEMENLIVNPSIPYIGHIDVDKFAPQKMIRINGAVPEVTYRFDINLQCGPSNIVPKNNIALQLSVRLLNEYVSINSFRDGMWEEELRKYSVPIKRGEKFEIIVLCTFDQYKVTINGQHYFDFPQRIYYDKISHLSIDGDVSIAKISYESVSSDFGNGCTHIYPTLSFHNLEFNDQSSCENSSFPMQSMQLISLSDLQPNPVTNDVVNSDSLPVQNSRQSLKIICIIFFIIIVIIVISLLILSNGRHIYFSSCLKNPYSANQSTLNE